VHEFASFPTESESVWRARSWLADRMPSDASDRSGDAGICLSELAANCVRHTSSSEFSVEVADIETGVRISVRDQDNLLPVAADATIDDPTGRGLTIVDAVSDRWGVTPHHPAGKTVWCEFERPASGTLLGRV
jgi:anti-sigma regulatory factor (Ser/Thr protein kinase)